MDWRIPSMLVVGVLASVAAIAAEPGTGFAEFSYQKPQHGTHGGAIRGSALLGTRVILQGGVDGWEHKGGGVGTASLGLGLRWQPHGSTSIVAAISAEGVVGDFGPEDEADSMSGVATGAGVGLLVSHRIEHVELLGGFKVTTMDTSRQVAMFGVRFYLWKHLALAADVVGDEFGTRIGIGLRLDLSRATR